MSSGGGGELGLPGGIPSELGRRRSGMKGGGAILPGGGGALGGGGRAIIGGLVLSTAFWPAEECTRERAAKSSPPALDESMDSMDCLRSDVDNLALLAKLPAGSRNRLARGPAPAVEDDDEGRRPADLGGDWPPGGGGAMNWNCCFVAEPTRKRPGEAGAAATEPGGGMKTGAGGPEEVGSSV